MILQEYTAQDGQQIWQITEGNNVFSLAIAPSTKQKDTGVVICTGVFNSSVVLNKLEVKGIASFDLLDAHTAVLYKFPWSQWEKILKSLVTNLINQP
jgi:hypothetical protein